MSNLTVNMNINSYAEIGIDKGITTMEVCKILNNGSSIYLFDTNEKCNNVKKMINDTYGDKFKVYIYTSEVNKSRDNYNWHLADLYAKSIKFDYVYIDGSHDFTIDGLSYFITDLMLNKNGYIEFDDYHWTFSSCKTYLQPEIANNINHPQNLDFRYSKEQQNIPHVKKIIDIFVKNNKSYIEIKKNRLYKKL